MSLAASSGSVPSELLDRDHHSTTNELERQVSELTNQNLRLLEQKQSLERKLATVPESGNHLNREVEQVEIRDDS